MEFFNKYSSNTYGGSGNQFFFTPAKTNERYTGRAFYKITNAGSYNYSLLFSNIIDSTYENGAVSHKNLICSSWVIHQARVAVCKSNALDCDFTNNTIANNLNENVTQFSQLTFNGNTCKNVAPGEFFNSDPIKLSFDKNDYICVEITFEGSMIPYHEESLLPLFSKTQNGWIYDRKMPLPAMIGCDREITAKIGFVGDSITQGIGTPINSYKHWNALLAEKIGSNYAYWNLGIGYARADDMATNGAWAYKAKHNDILVVCYGVNDLNNKFSAEQIINNLEKIVAIFKKQKLKIILQTIPPFDYCETTTKKWIEVNNYIKNVLSKKVEHVFDIAPYLAQSDENPQNTKYGDHPNAIGCEIWANAFYQSLIDAKIF